MIFLILVISLFFAPTVQALDPIIKITNFSSNSSPEWVELNNTTENIVSLDAWLLKDGNNISGDDLILTGCLSPFAYLTFFHDSGWLNDSGDTVSLYDNLNNLIDSLTYTQGKIDSSPRSNNTCIPTLTPTLAPTPTPEIFPTPTSSPNPLIITEIMANPETNQDEWIEIYNPSDSPFPLKNLCFFDASNHSRCFLDSDTINSKSYFIRQFSSGFLNNDGDTVSFIDTSIIYPKSPKNFTYSRQENNSWCFANPSQNSVNTECVSNTSSDNFSPAPPLILQFSPDYVHAGEDFNLVFNLNSPDSYSLRLIFPFGSQYFPFGNYKDGYSWLNMPLTSSKKLPPGTYPMSFHLKKLGSSHLYDYQFGNLVVKEALPKGKVLGSTVAYKPLPTPTLFVCPSQNISPTVTLPDLNFFSWPFLFAGSILFLSPLLFPKLYTA